MLFKKEVALLVLGGFVATLSVASCGKSSDEKAETKSTLQKIAEEAMDQMSPEEEAQELTALIAASGYVIREYRSFPSQQVGKKARVLIYTDKKGKSSGGVIYLKKTGYAVAPAWHWYFSNDVPEAVENVELNDDGLWDLRISLKGGKTVEFIQDKSFDFAAADRTDWIALNGASSEPVGEASEMWRCFDGDSTTAWRSSLGAGGEAFLEVAAPFGVADGVLTLQTMDHDQPHECTLFADGKKLQEFELEPKAASQIIRLDDGAKGAKSIRLTFGSAYGDGDVVSVAEMTLK